MGTMITLKSSNYQLWKTKMLDLLYREDLFKPIVNKGKMPVGGDEDEWKLMNRRATATIRLWVDDSLIYHVFEETDAYLIWKKLEGLFERKDAWSKLSEVRKLMNLKYKDGQNVVKYLNEFQGVLNQLEVMELAMDDEVKALILLSSLPFSLADSVLSFCDSAHHGRKLNLETVMCSILNAAKQGKRQKCKHELAEAASMDIDLKKMNPSKKVKNAADKSILSSLLKLLSTIGAVMVIFLWVFMVELGTLGNRFVVQKYWVSSDFDSDLVPIERVYENNGYLMVTCNGGLNQMRTGVSSPCPCEHGQALKGDSSSMICDMVTIARFLNLTLIVPELDNTSFWHDTSTFQDIFDVDYFIKSLRDGVRILKELPPEEESRLESTSLHSITPKLWSRMSFYYRKVLPEIRKHKVLHFNQSNTRLINNDLPDEIQKLRCRVNYNALRFTAPIEEIGRKIVRILRQKGPFLALHLRYEMDILAFTGCAQGLTHNETVELIKMRDFYPWWKTRGHPAKKRKGGGCPLTPGEAALALQSLGIDRNMQIYIASGDIYGGETRLAPLVEAYPNLVRKEKLLDPSDLKPFSGHWNQMAALDYTVSLESDIFVPTQAGNMALAVEGHRRYLGFRTTIMLNKKLLVSLIDQYKIGKLSWDDFSFIMKAAHADRMGKPKKRLKIPGQPQHEDSFYANPEECLPQMVKT